MEFKPFEEIKNIRKVDMRITQKIHGTNAQIIVTEDLRVQAGSRNRFIYPGDDNYGFAAFVDANKDELIQKLGVGTYYGEWAGPGINSGEGLKEKTFVLFDWWKFPPERPLPPQCSVVPLLYNGVFDLSKIDEVMTDLKTNGSKLAPGFMKPEGIIIQTMGTRLKKVFDAEETGWTKSGKSPGSYAPKPDIVHLLQPIRMEKLLSRDEKYIKNYPNSLPDICRDYVADLIKEGEITGDEDQIKAIRKSLGRELFQFAKQMVGSGS